MKKFRILILSLLCLLLVVCLGACAPGACNPYKNDVLETPQGISFSDTEILTWNKVKNAAAYAVNINGEEFITHETSVDLFTRLYEYKSYEIKVKAVGEDFLDMPDNGENYIPVQSPYSSSVFYEIEEPNFIYQYSKQTIHITNINKIHGKLVVPMTLNSMPVLSTDIGGSNCDGITGILVTNYYKRLNKNIETNKYSFCDMTNVKRIYFPDKEEDDASAPTSTSFTLKNLNSLEMLTFPGNLYGGYDGGSQSITISGNVAFEELNFPEGEYSASISECNVKKLTFPKTLTLLAPIVDMPNLESLNWPITISTYISQATGRPLFDGCPNLTTLTFDEIFYRNYYFQGGFLMKEKAVIDYSGDFYPSDYYKSVEAYFGDSETVIIPAGVTTLRSPIFKSRFEHLDILTIPDSVTYIDGSFFYGLKSIGQIGIDSSIKRYILHSSSDTNEFVLEPVVYKTTKDNAIIKNDDTLIYPGNSIKIPDGIKTIGSYCFQGRDLTDLYIPSSVTDIMSGAFSDCTMPQLYIPKSVTSFNVYKFYNYKNKSLTLPNYNILRDAFNARGMFWEDVTLYLPNEHFNNGSLKDTTIVFGCNMEYDDDYPYVYSFNYTGYDARYFDINQASIQLSEYHPKVYAPARRGYEFLGWSATKDSATAEYAAVPATEEENSYVTQDTFNQIPKNTLLYAVWKKI